MPFPKVTRVTQGRDGIGSQVSRIAKLVTLKFYSMLPLRKKKKILSQMRPFPLTDPYSCFSEPSNWGCQRMPRSHPNELAQLLKLHNLLGRGASSVNIDVCLRHSEPSMVGGAAAAEI